ncbi:hypothetical protein VSU19_09975 [Verrucomicrobiales bacterium BCK34]|nr:hypothetical protein [Verrucomicrobiales bacterium BCK34]
MKYIDLLGQQLKSNDVIDVLECGDLDVVYAFDRLFENQPDEYWVASKKEGVQLHFNEDQRLDLMFFYIVPDEGFSRCDQATLGVPIFGSRDEAREQANSEGREFWTGETDIFGVYREWIKIDFGTHHHHSEFREAGLHRVSASLPPTAQSGRNGD